MNYKIVNIFTALFFVILFSTTVVIAAENTAGVEQAMDKAGFTEKQVLEVKSTLNFARQKGLPEGIIADKMQEGIAKQIAPDRIVQAIERIASRYNHAHVLAGNLVKGQQNIAQLGNIVAAGMAAGLTIQDAEKLMAEVKSKQTPGTENYPLAKEAMLMARDLTRRGVASTTTAEVVEKALQKGLNVNEMRAMRGAFNKQGTQSSIEAFAKGNRSAANRSPEAQGMATGHGTSGSEGAMGGTGGDSSGAGGEAGSGGNGGSGGESGSGAGSGGGGGSGSGGSGGSGGHR